MSTLQNYELYLIFNPELSTTQIQSEIEKIQAALSLDVSSSEAKVYQEGLKKLAYPIKKHVTGFYTLINFDTEITTIFNMKNIEKKLNLNENVIRYIIVNQTEFLKQKSKEKRNKVDITNHRELNKGKTTDKKCISTYMGIEVVDYKDTVFLNQFTSPYAKIFVRSKTGSKAKFQRKITQAIKRARHMALMPFTPKYSV